jgi:hypothetical protein
MNAYLDDEAGCRRRTSTRDDLVGHSSDERACRELRLGSCLHTCQKVTHVSGHWPSERGDVSNSKSGSGEVGENFVLAGESLRVNLTQARPIAVDQGVQPFTKRRTDHHHPVGPQDAP